MVTLTASILSSSPDWIRLYASLQAAAEALTSASATLAEHAVLIATLQNQIQAGAGSPNGSVTGTKGQLYRDTTNGVIYVNKDGSTAWTALAEVA